MLNDTFYTLEELSKQLHVSLEVVQEEVKSGRLRAVIIGGQHYRVRETDLEQYLTNSYTTATPTPNTTAAPAELEIILRTADDFDHTWPDQTLEHFTNAYEGIATFAGKERHVKLGHTIRKSAGQDRSRIVVFVDRYPAVEFVAATKNIQPADNMASILRNRDGKQIPVGATLPAEYTGMPVGAYRSVVDGSGASNGMAVICAASDYDTMIKHALVRIQFKDERA